MPKNVEDFIDLKYNKEKIEEWKDLKLRRQIRKNYNLNINIGRQEKHIEGTNNYNQELAKGNIKSILAIPIEEAQELVNKHAGTAEIRRAKGKWIEKEFVKIDKIIGKVLNEHNEWENTNYFSIEYSKKKGTHIVPRLLE